MPHAPCSIWRAKSCGAMEVLPCGAKARPWRSGVVSSEREVVLQALGGQGEHGGREAAGEEVAALGGQLADGQPVGVRRQALEAVVHLLPVQFVDALDLVHPASAQAQPQHRAGRGPRAVPPCLTPGQDRGNHRREPLHGLRAEADSSAPCVVRRPVGHTDFTNCSATFRTASATHG